MTTMQIRAIDTSSKEAFTARICIESVCFVQFNER